MDDKYINQPTKWLPFKGYSFKKLDSVDQKNKAKMFFYGIGSIGLYVKIGICALLLGLLFASQNDVTDKSVGIVFLLLGIAVIVPNVILLLLAKKSTLNTTYIEEMKEYFNDVRKTVLTDMLEENAERDFSVIDVTFSNYFQSYKNIDYFCNHEVSSNQYIQVKFVSGSQIVIVDRKFSFLTNEIADDIAEYYISDIVSLSVKNDQVVIKMNSGENILLTKNEAYSGAVNELRNKIREIKKG